MTVVSFEDGRRTRRRRERLGRMEAAALELFAARGLEATTIQQITDAADVAKGTFFNYFSSKEDVLAQRFSRLAGEIIASTEIEGNPDPFLRLIEFFDIAERRFRAEGAPMLLLYREALVRPDLRTVDTEAEDRVLAFYARLLSRGQSSGSLRPGFDVALGAHLINDIWASTLRSWMSRAGDFGLADRLETKIGLVFDGFRVPST